MLVLERRQGHASAFLSINQKAPTEKETPQEGFVFSLTPYLQVDKHLFGKRLEN